MSKLTSGFSNNAFAESASGVNNIRFLPPAHRAIAKSLNVNRKKTRHRRKPAPGPSPLRKQVTMRNNHGIGRALKLANRSMGAPWLAAPDSPAPAGAPAVLRKLPTMFNHGAFAAPKALNARAPGTTISGIPKMAVTTPGNVRALAGLKTPAAVENNTNWSQFGENYENLLFFPMEMGKGAKGKRK